MATTPKFCEQCGAALTPGARFCEMCGKPVGATPAAEPVSPAPVVQPVSVPPAAQAETIIGHLPAEMLGKGLIGWGKKISLVVTTERLLCLRETKVVQKTWDDEIERLIEQQETSGTPWRTLIDNYNFHNPLWATFYNTPPAKLLAAHKDNVAIPIANIVSVAVTLTEEEDSLEIRLANGETRTFLSVMGNAAAGFLAQVLGPDRVRIE